VEKRGSTMNEKLYLGCAKPPVHPQHLQIIDSTWTLIDLYVDDPSVIKMDARHLEYPENSVSKIYTSHLLEHFGLKEVQDALLEWYRALQPGGELIISVPDLLWASEELIRLENEEPPRSPVFYNSKMIMEIIYGNQEHEGEFHKSGFTKNILEECLENAGFKNIKIKSIYEAHEMSCLVATAVK
jgi:predicted SAM-dependent methyltransferase